MSDDKKPEDGEVKGEPTTPSSVATDEQPSMGERRESKVRFSEQDDSSSEGSVEPDHLYDAEAVRKQAQAGGRRGSIRRTSLAAVHGHHEPKEPESLPSYHPRSRIADKYEAWDYNQVESQLFIDSQSMTAPKTVQRMAVMRWVISFLVGVYVAFIAVVVAMLITYLSKLKFMLLYKLLEDRQTFASTIPGLLVWMLWNVAFIFTGAYLVTFHAPEAAGSGIPQVKCYLNGIRLPGLMSVRTLIAKAGGVVLSVVGGLCCGKEGPMIHSGALCASGLASGKFGCCGKSCTPGCCDGLRSDEERRDFVAAGAASGVSAAFASPVGGVLFALEEGASFVKQMLTWRMLFSSVTAGMFLNIFMSTIKGHPNDMSSPGLISFGYLGDIDYRTFELVFFMLMAIIGGLLGALFVGVNYKITLFRRRSVTNKWAKVGEACFIAMVSAIVLYSLIYVVPDCAPIKGYHPPQNDSLDPTSDDPHAPSDDHHAAAPVEDSHTVHKRSSESHDESADETHDEGHGNETHELYGWHGHGYVFQGFCPYGEQNRMADILFKTPEGGLHAMLHGELDDWSLLPLLVLVVIYHLLTTWTYGLNVSSGLFIPSLLIGAVWGRMVGMVIMNFLPSTGTNIAKYVLVGASSQLGGFVRMTISLSVIVIECTGDITFSIPIISGLIIAKWVGDFFNPGIYDLHIEIWGAPLLGWEPPEMSVMVPAHEVMSTPVVAVRTVESIGRLDKLLKDPNCHNGFPVVDDYDPMDTSQTTYGRLRGFILKKGIEELLRDKDVREEDTLDLRLHMDKSPFAVQEDVSLPRIFKLFRGLGLRHLVVINYKNRVVGLITRLNVARFRGEVVKGKFRVEELEVLDR